MDRGLAECRALREHLKRGGVGELGADARGMWKWLAEVSAASSSQLAVALMNERLAEVRRETDVGSEIPRVSARIALTAGTALAVLALLVGTPGAVAAVWAGATFGVGLMGAVGAAQIGRISRSRTREQIETWNWLVKKLVARAHVAESDKAEISEHE